MDASLYDGRKLRADLSRSLGAHAATAARAYTVTAQEVVRAQSEANWEIETDTNLTTVLPSEKIGGRDRVRTGDPLLAKQVLSQLSYTPKLI